MTLELVVAHTEAALDMPQLQPHPTTPAELVADEAVALHRVDWMLMTAQHDVALLRYALLNELVLPCAMPLAWLAEFLKLPVKRSFVGLDLIDHPAPHAPAPIKVLFTGGTDGATVKYQYCGKAIPPSFGEVWGTWTQPILLASTSYKYFALNIYC